MPTTKKITSELKMVNIHQVKGDLVAIEYLKNADFHLVESFFHRAKMTGRTTFEFHGVTYELLKNRDLTYSVGVVPEHVPFVESM